MKIVVSPAKSLDFKTQVPVQRATLPIFLDKAEKLNGVMQKKSVAQIKKLMDISDTIAQLNAERYRDFSIPFTAKNARQAMYAFAGDVYVGLDAYTIPEDKIDFTQNTLRMLSGMYGLLKPLDLIQPYRLEMGTKLKVNRANNLYEFWGDSITKALNEEMDKGEVLVNLASTEYFKAINVKKLNTQVVNPIFMDYKNGQLKIISFFAKKARGLMSRFIIDNQLTEVEDILGFDYEGYSYSEKETKSPDKPVFIR